MSYPEPRYPVYIISKGRADCCHTANFFTVDEMPFRLVIEPQEFDLYAARYPEEQIIVLPFSNLGQGSIPARNFVWEHSRDEGHERHWILDDNIREIRRLWKGHRIPINAHHALYAAEVFTDRYTNIGISGFNYLMFVPDVTQWPIFVNCHVYSSLLIRNDLPYRWRGRYNEDTDLCLQVLAGGFCTVSFNIFHIHKVPTMKMKGGNEQLYEGDGRLAMARSLERAWPGVVSVSRRWQRPQHVVNWRKFDTPLARRTDLDWGALTTDEFGIRLVAVGEVKNQELKDLLTDAETDQTF